MPFLPSYIVHAVWNHAVQQNVELYVLQMYICDVHFALHFILSIEMHISEVLQ